MVWAVEPGDGSDCRALGGTQKPPLSSQPNTKTSTAGRPPNGLLDAGGNQILRSQLIYEIITVSRDGASEPRHPRNI